MTDWTKDADGEYIRWNRPPHYVNGVLNLLLPGEERVSMGEISKRRGEYMKLARRDLGRKSLAS